MTTTSEVPAPTVETTVVFTFNLPEPILCPGFETVEVESVTVRCEWYLDGAVQEVFTEAACYGWRCTNRAGTHDRRQKNVQQVVPDYFTAFTAPFTAAAIDRYTQAFPTMESLPR